MKQISEMLKKILEESGISNDKPPAHVPLPALPKSGKLSQDDQWLSILWIIDTAELHGKEALRGLALAFGKIIQGDALKKLLTDARWESRVLNSEALLWDEPINIAGEKNMLDLLAPTQSLRDVTFSESIVLASPWERWRLCRALETIANKVWKQDDNHQVELWLPWPILWVTNGNHSVTAGMIYGKGQLKDINCYDATPLLSSVITDGNHWFRATDNTVVGPVCSIEMAAIFEIGRRLIKP